MSQWFQLAETVCACTGMKSRESSPSKLKKAIAILRLHGLEIAKYCKIKLSR
jgi:hypothetical protein